MKTCIIVIVLNTFFTGCLSTIMSVEKGRFHYYQKGSPHYYEIDVEFYAKDSIKVSTNRGGINRTCLGTIKQIKNNTYQVICYDTRGFSKSRIGDYILRLDTENDTLVYHRSYIIFWGAKLKKVATKP